jgi:hypothetical protein
MTLTGDTITGFAYVVFGLAICFAGYRFFRLFLMIAGFILGFSAVMQLNGAGYDFSNLPLVVVAVVVGLVVAILAWFLYRFGLALAGGLAGASLAMLLAQALAGSNITGITSALIMIVGFVVGMLAAFMIADLIVMISTALYGANTTASGLILLFPTVVTGPVILIVVLLLAAFGFITQWQTGGRTRRGLI